MGRLVGIRFFETIEHHEEVTDDGAQLRKCKQDSSDNNNAIREILTMAILRVQGQFDGRFIRRTATSLDNKGEALISLPPCTVVDLVLKLSERELQFVDDGIPDEAIDRSVLSISVSSPPLLRLLSLSHATALGSVTESFYCMERMAVTFPREDTNAPVPKFSTREEWDATRSTKIDAVVRLVRYLLKSDNTLPPFTKDGKLFFPKIPPTEDGASVSRTRKILIYQEYSFFAPLLINVRQEPPHAWFPIVLFAN